MPRFACKIKHTMRLLINIFQSLSVKTTSMLNFCFINFGSTFNVVLHLNLGTPFSSRQ